MKIDLNCDLGEGIGNDEAIMPYISSCNIACAAHAGNTATMRNTIALAKRHSVKIGAHPSYPDRGHFGRRVLDISNDELLGSIQEQVNDLKALLSESDITLNHIKPHGALYNEAAINEEVARVVVIAAKTLGDKIQLYVPYKSVIAELAQSEGIKTKYEAFADRAYEDNLQLVSRAIAGAVLYDPEIIYQQVIRMINDQQVATISGNFQKIIVNTICLHGDNPEALDIAKYLFKKLTADGIRIK